MRRFQEWRCALRTLGVALLFFLLFNRPVPAAITSNWSIDAGGDFSNPTNWDNGVPGPTDTAVFRRGNADYIVTFTGDVATDKLRVGTNTITFRPSSNGGTYSVGNPFLPEINTAEIVIGELAADTAVLNSYLPKFTFGQAKLAQVAGSTGTLNVLSGSLSGTEIDVGVLGSGAVHVSNGSVVNAVAHIGSISGPQGTVTIVGPGSTWNGTIAIGRGQLDITNGGHLNGRLSLSGPNSGFSSVRIDGQGSALITDVSVDVAGANSRNEMSITNGGHIQSSAGTIAFSDNLSIGIIAVDGAGSAWENTAELKVGSLGTGTLSITRGGSVSNTTAYVGSSLSGFGTVTVDGPGSKWNCSNALYIGPASGLPTSLSGSGSLAVTGGATVTTATTGSIDVTSSAVVDGTSSRWDIGGDLLAYGTLSVTSGAQVTSADATVGSFINPAQVTVRGNGSKMALSGNLSIVGGTLAIADGGQVAVGGSTTIYSKLQGDGSFVGNIQNYGTVAPGNSAGRLTINGNYTSGASAFGTIQIELGGTVPGTTYDQLVVTGDVTLGGTLQVLLTNGFTPAPGNSFDILDWGSLDSTFDVVSLPKLSSDLLWDSSLLYTTGVISVTTVPEPAAAVLFAMGTPVLLAAASMCRRKPRRNR